MKLYAFVIFLMLFQTSSFGKDVVNYPWASNNYFSYNSYYKSVLHLALEKSQDKFGSYSVNATDTGDSQEHLIRLVQENKFVNLFWTMTSAQREQALLPVRFPLFKGLLGCRIFLIKKGQQSKFNQLKSTEQLKSLVAGLGEDWPDSKVLSFNKFKLATSTKDRNLFQMLSKDRFDYFPRALHEARSEILQHPKLEIEKRFLLYYDSPFYFFVNKENKRLASRLEYGLKVAFEDGSFEQLFDNHPVSANILEQFNLAERELIVLDNPLLTKQSKQLLEKMGTRKNCLGKRH